VRQRTEGLLSLGPISGWLQACFQLRGKGKRTGRARASGAPTAPKPGQAGLRGAARARRSPRKKRGGGRERSRSRMLRGAVANFLRREKAQVEYNMEALTACVSPYKEVQS